MLTDKDLSRYLELDDYIKVLEKERDAIKDRIKSSNQTETDTYLIVKGTHERTTIHDIPKLIEILGTHFLQPFLTVSLVTRIKVMKKPKI